jgi:uncharacterized protein CbrC (UPF0167 family)
MSGSYEDPWYGSVEIRAEVGRLAIVFSRTPGLTGWLEPWREDTFLVRWKDRTLQADALLRFEVGRDNQAVSASMQRFSPFTAPAFDFQDLRLVRHQNSTRNDPVQRRGLPGMTV